MYLRANSTAQGQITKWAWVKKSITKGKKEAIYNMSNDDGDKNNNNNKNRSYNI
jgi:hypothetical protein